MLLCSQLLNTQLTSMAEAQKQFHLPLRICRLSKVDWTLLCAERKIKQKAFMGEIYAFYCMDLCSHVH